MSHSEIVNVSLVRWLVIILVSFTVGMAVTACSVSDDQPNPENISTAENNAVIAEEPTPVSELAPSNAMASPPALNELVLSGEQVYSKACAVCHATGVTGAPIYGDTATWSPRIEQGIEILYRHAIDGFTGKLGYMPPKGGFMTLSNSETLAAVDYMLDAI